MLMCLRPLKLIILAAGVFTSSVLALEQSEGGSDATAEALFAKRCAVCHEGTQANIPSRTSLTYRGPDSVVRSLTDGLMKEMAVGLSAEQIDSLAVLLTGRKPTGFVDPMKNACDKSSAPVVVAEDDWSSLSGDLHNTRFKANSSIKAKDIDQLQVEWAFAYPGGAPGVASLAGGRLFLATGTGYIMALDADTGCTYWAYDNGGAITRRVSVAPIEPGSKQVGVFFGDANGRATALDARTGKLLWQTEIEEHVLSRVTSAPSIYNGRVYVPVSSIEDPLTHDPSYQCCTSRGSVVALDASTGDLIWKQYNIMQAPKALAHDEQSHAAAFSPAGAAVYLPLAIDARRNVLYAATAESYTVENPPGPYSVIAYDLDTGARKWEQQFLPGAAEREKVCKAVGYTDCRNLFSMGTAVTIQTLPDGREILLAGQKWGYVYALDPDNEGQLLWKNKVAAGGDLGGIMYGVAVDQDAVYVPISDAYTEKPGGLVRLDPKTGKTRWQIEAPEAQCSWDKEECEAAAVSAATLIPGAVFVGFSDGHLRVYGTESGNLLRDFDLARPFEAANGIPAHGGPVNGYPVIVGEDAIYVVSGGSTQTRPGNVLLKLTVARP